MCVCVYIYVRLCEKLSFDHGSMSINKLRQWTVCGKFMLSKQIYISIYILFWKFEAFKFGIYK